MTNKKKKAFITGITGQDGSYLAEFLVEKNYEVHGLVRRSSGFFNISRIKHLCDASGKNKKCLFLHYGDLADAGTLNRLIKNIKPDEVYNLGAQSHVKISFEIPEYTVDIVGLGTLRMLDAIRQNYPQAKFYQASSSEMFGKALEIPQKETTPFNPQSPYAIAKVFAHNIAVNYRNSYNIFVCCGILFNHESPRRGDNFVTKKISQSVANIVAGKQKNLYLGNLDAQRDWGYAPEYCEAMWLMLQQDKPDDYVIATGETHSVKEFVQEAFGYVGLDWGKYVKIDKNCFRPSEVPVLVGDAGKAKKKLNWRPKVKFKQLVRIMVEEDLKEIAEKKHA